MGAANDCCPPAPGEPQRRDVVPSRLLTVWVLGEATQRSPRNPVSRFRPVFPSSLLSFLLVASFVLSSGGSEVSPGGRWGAGSRPLVCLPPILTTFLANSPSSGWLASALVLSADGDTEVAKGCWRRRGKWQLRSWLRPQDMENELTLHMSGSLLVSADGFPGNKLKWLWSGVMFVFLPSPPPL